MTKMCGLFPLVFQIDRLTRRKVLRNSKHGCVYGCRTTRRHLEKPDGRTGPKVMNSNRQPSLTVIMFSTVPHTPITF